MQTLTQIRRMLDERGLAPKKSLGQNFLHDQNLIRRLVEESGVEAGDLVLEVGPGTGALTSRLLEVGCRVVACELDDGLADLLQDTFGDRIHLVRGDVLAGKHMLNPEVLDALGTQPFTLVANLPYQAAGPLMIRLSIDGLDCRGQYVTIQREVGERLRAEPGTKTYGELTILVGAVSDVRRIATLPPECFWPRPKVVSEMVAIEPRGTPLVEDFGPFVALCSKLFRQRRKQIGAILGRDIDWPEGVEPNMRPEALTPSQIAALVRVTGPDTEEEI